MHEYSKRIADHIKSCYGNLGEMKLEELCELEKWAKVIKDLTEYDVNKRAIEAMDEAKEEEKLMHRIGGDRMGYRGRDSGGRFVHRPGRGRSAGYSPLFHMMPELDGMYDEDYSDMMPEIMNYRMGYSDGRGGSHGGSGNYGGRSDGGSYGEQSGNSGRSGYEDGMGYSHEGQRGGSRRGETYDRYRDNRRHYTDSKDAESKKKMDESMKEYMDDAMDSMKEMWKDADPQLRQTMKADLTKLVQQLQ